MADMREPLLRSDVQFISRGVGTLATALMDQGMPGSAGLAEMTMSGMKTSKIS